MTQTKTSTTARSGRSRLGLWIIGGAAVITVALIIAVALASRTPVPDDAHAEVPAAWINGNELGNPEAPVVLEAYEDFLCPHCSEFNKAVKNQLVEDYIISGDVKFVYKFFPLDMFAPSSYNAARGGQCMINLSDDFWTYHDTLFFGERGTSRFTVEGLSELAGELGVRQVDFVECMGSVQVQDAVDQSVRDGIAAGVQGTPTLLINGERYSGNSTNYDAIKTALNAALQ